MDIAKLFRASAVNYPGKKFIIFNGRVINFSEAFSRVNKLAHYLTRNGIKKGDRVAIYLPNSPEYVISYFAVFSLGAIAVPLDIRLTVEELIGILNHAGASLLFSRALPKLPFKRISQSVPGLKGIVCCSAENQEGAYLYNKIIAEERDEPPGVDIRDDDIAVIFYTSGTTGHPKAVMLNYKSLENAHKTVDYFLNRETEIGEVQICALPLSHIGGFIYVQFISVWAMTTVLMEHFVPLEFLKNIQRHRVSWFHLVPSMFTAILALKEFEKYDLSSLKGVDIFGAPSHPDLIKRFGRYCPDAKLFQGWGMTETAAPNVVVTDSEKIASAGKAPPWLEMKIVDNDDKELPAGKIGELVVRGWPVMAGYYKEPELTNQVMRGGWLHTGDLASLDEQGYLYIKGRKKDMIIVGGLNVYPPEIERVIAEFPGVKEVAVVGISDKLRGETIKAVVVMQDGKQSTAKEIRVYCRRHLARFKIPQTVEFRKELPKNRAGKIKKELLK
jgi:acyl-CoA synthetase (AMP-forming)/AMP-acid ligase II